VIFLTVHVKDVPWVPDEERVKVRPLGHQFYQVDVYWGFSDEPNVPRALELCRSQGLAVEPMETSYFPQPPAAGSGHRTRSHGQLARTIVRRDGSQRGRSGDYYRLPTNRVAELGAQIEI